MTDLWTIMQSDHDRIWGLLSRLTGSDAVHGEQERRTTARQLVAVVSGHEAAEELVIWPAARQLSPGGADISAEALEQESHLKWALDELSRLAHAHEEFDACARVVAGLARTHLTYEQNQAWPRLGDELSAADSAHLTAQWLSTRWLTARRHSSTRPHPRISVSEPALVVGQPAGRSAHRDGREQNCVSG
jgi:hypothetical protein